MGDGAKIGIVFGIEFIMFGTVMMGLVLSRKVAIRHKLGTISKHDQKIGVRIGLGYCALGLVCLCIGLINIA